MTGRERRPPDLLSEGAREDLGSRLGAVVGRRLLDDLDAAAVAVKVAERAEVHQQVEGEGVAGLELAREVVVGAAMGNGRRETACLRSAGSAARTPGPGGSCRRPVVAVEQGRDGLILWESTPRQARRRGAVWVADSYQQFVCQRFQRGARRLW